MSKSFADLKKSRESSFKQLADTLQKANAKTYESDNENFWYPAVDKSGNGEAVIRFLPAPEVGQDPYVRLFTHGFQSDVTGKWYIQNCPTTLGGDHTCPACEYNSKLWNTGEKESRDQASKQKRKLGYIANVLVIRDKLNPENEGTVKLFRFGKKIMDMINGKMFPEFEGEEPMNPFDMFEGANFKIRIRNVAGYRNYDASVFESVAPLDKSEKVMEKIWSQTHDLTNFIAPSNFKPYSELQVQFNRVLALDTPVVRNVVPVAAKMASAPWEDDEKTEAPKAKSVAPKKQPVVEDDSDDDDLEALMAKLKED